MTSQPFRTRETILRPRHLSLALAILFLTIVSASAQNKGQPGRANSVLIEPPMAAH